MPLGIVAILLLLAPQYLFATTFNVTSNADSGPGTLRQAITNAVAKPSINFLYHNSWPFQLIVSNDCGSETLDINVAVIRSGILEIGTSILNISEPAGNLTIQANNQFKKGILYTLINLISQLIGSNIQASSNQNSIHPSNH
jgi:hypothetical protein